jgi:pimeloyl-ACP methyl ester carboxylesterase
LHGDRVSFWDSGPADGDDGELVVLVHGIAGSAHTWSPLLAELARRRDRRRFIAPDLLGHGSSSAPWADYSLGGYATGLRDLIVSLGHRRVTIVGHSLGGGVVQQFAFQFPQHCARLVLIDSGGLGREVSPALRAATLPGAEWVIPVIADRRLVDLAGALGRRLAWAGRHVPASAREAARAYASLADPVHRRAFVHTARSVIDSGGQRVRATNRLDLADQLPVLIAWGTADTMIPVAHAHRAHDLVPGSELALFEGAGHFPHCDQPQAFADRLLDFLDRRAPAVWDPGHLAERIAEHATFDDDGT